MSNERKGWHSLWLNQSSENFDATPTPRIKKEASNGRDIARSMENVLFAGTNIALEELELEENLKELIEAEEDYKFMEDFLNSFGYSRTKIRKKFEQMTGVDPVQAFLDVENFIKPPSEIPLYNYGWGESKDASKADYYYVLPLADQYALYAQKGASRNVVSKYITIKEAKEELKSRVKEINEVTPDSKNIEHDIIRRVSRLEIPTNPSENFRKVFNTVYNLSINTPLSIKVGFIREEYQKGTLDKVESEWLLRYAQAEEEDGEDTDVLKEDLNEQYQQFKDDTKNKPMTEVIDDIKIPQKTLDKEIDQAHKVDMKEISLDSFNILEDHIRGIRSFKVVPSGQAIDQVDIESYSVNDESHIDTGSVSFVLDITDLKNNKDAKGLVVLFIQNGTLSFDGIFKGQTDREYALSDEGITAYFEDLSGISVDKLEAAPLSKQDTGQYGATTVNPYKGD